MQQIKPFTYQDLIVSIARLEAENKAEDKDLLEFYRRLLKKTEKDILKTILKELKLN
mgnify:CR=1 FL=1